MSRSDSSVVIDTNVISLFIREDELADFYRDQIAGLRHLVSFQTVIELAQYLESYKVIWPDNELIDVCAQLRHERRSVGRELGLADAWIAATALLQGCPLASSDRDFLGIPELELIQAA